MPRNIERDEKEAMRRKEQLMEAGFRLFSQYGIENVSLQRVADAAEVGVATLYNYYQTKVKLVIAISGKIWAISGRRFWKKRDRRYLNHSRRISTLSFIRTRSSGFTGNDRKCSGSVITIKTLSPGRRSRVKCWLNIWMF